MYSVLLLAAIVAMLELAARVYAGHLNIQEAPKYPDLQSYIGDVEGKARTPVFLEAEGELPGVVGPKVVLRLPDPALGSSKKPLRDEYYQQLLPRDLPAPPRTVWIMGGSAAYGIGVTFAQSFGGLLEGALGQDLSDPSLRVLNLSRPAWELTSVTGLLDRLMAAGVRPPRALIVFSGNNEFLTPPLHGVQGGRWHHLGLYRIGHELARRHGWLRPPAGQDHHQYEHPYWDPVPLDYIKTRIWWPGDGIDNASHWVRIRDIYREQFDNNLKHIERLASKNGLHLVLVPPPINLHFFPGGVRPQPVTPREISSGAYRALAEKLEQALDAGDMERIRGLVQQEPAGPIQRFVLGQWLGQQGHHAAAVGQLTQARDDMMGVLGSLPTFHRILRGRAGPGVTVLPMDDLYPPGVSIRLQARKLFLDACHPTPLLHSLLAKKLRAALAPLLRSTGDEKNNK